MTSPQNRTFELVDLHDAVVKEPIYRASHELVLRFGSVSVYESTGPERYDLVSYDADLIGFDPRELRCGPFGELDQVSTVRLDTLELGERGETELARRSEPCDGGLVEVQLTSGEAIVFRCAQLCLRLGDRGEVFDQWLGPL
jgi:hypothetical protein